MAATTFDTRIAVKVMKASGIDEPPVTVPVLRPRKIAEVLQGVGFQANQAQAAAALIRWSRGHDPGVMKKQDSTASVESLEQCLIARLALFERRMTIRFGLMLVVADGLVVAGIKFL